MTAVRENGIALVTVHVTGELRAATSEEIVHAPLQRADPPDELLWTDHILVST